MRYLLLCLVAGVISGNLFAQSLFMPRNVQAAYTRGTRSLDGNPGKNYWQNHARYNINITAMPPDRTIKGNETINYINNSPDTVRRPAIKLFINIHKPGAPRNFGANDDYLTSGVHIDAITANGTSITPPEDAGTFTFFNLRLPAPLAPHDSVQLTFDWHYEISKQSGREGMIDSTAYFLAYFYPRVAVYDDYNGWDRMQFMDSHEFYSDFNDYTVTVNVPKNYIVVGTGTLQQPEKLLQPEILERYKQSFTSDATINIVTPLNVAAKNVTAQHDVNSWQFVATNIPDVAFGLSDHFLWDGCSVIVDDKTGRRAGAFAMYNDTAADYHRVAQYAKHSLDWLSHNWPGIPYPYEKTTVFQGYAGMEYPMMANDETYSDTLFSRFVAEHEIAHTYMPFYMGINETRYGFMDEGWATTFEYLIGSADIGTEAATELFKQFRVDGWINDPSDNQQIPIVTPGDALSGTGGFGNNEYGKAALGYLAMKDLLGDDLFKKCLHAYMDRWHGKHPIPWDFFYTFNDVSGKNLNWFWNNWFFSTYYIDLALTDVKTNANNYTVVIKNIGGMAAPVNVIAEYEDGSSEKFHQTPAIWMSDQTQTTISINAKKKIKSLTLDGGIFMDADVSNNNWNK
ncbi:MAG TPA: M1 family metallopeptidase [Parafilimonas sp.]|nr:M1 family metallopeptidase [Parafilimonas sp.]